jgi:BirA family transcriptional regulator, biotin operon repressor / biotin---[acetyl-CoA-carboxylase] ligase
MPPDFSAEDVERIVRGAFGRPCRVYEEVGSTNDAAAAWAEEGAPEEAVVVAHRQTAGRGRRGREWLSQADRSLLFSVILRPPVGTPLGLIPIALGVGCANAIESFGIDARIKWPNDIVVAERKVAGILVETGSRSGTTNAVIGGIGVNYNLDTAAIPDEISARATSIIVEWGEDEPPTRLEVLARLLDSISSAYALLLDRSDEIVERARTRSTLLGKDVQVSLPNGSSLVGRALDIASDGGLIVSAQRSKRTIYSGDVMSIREGQTASPGN